MPLSVIARLDAAFHDARHWHAARLMFAEPHHGCQVKPGHDVEWLPAYL
jgi:hypothetical protein